MPDLEALRRYAASLRGRGSPYSATSHTGIIQIIDELLLARAVVEASELIRSRYPGGKLLWFHEFSAFEKALKAYRAYVKDGEHGSRNPQGKCDVCPEMDSGAECTIPNCPPEGSAP